MTVVTFGSSETLEAKRGFGTKTRRSVGVKTGVRSRRGAGMRGE